jgi:anti-sigma factor RsiW
MGSCRRDSELNDWVLDELTPAKARELEEHVKHCAECARSFEQLSGLRRALTSGLTDQEIPAHLVLVAEGSKRTFANFWASLVRTAALSAAAACIFLTVLSFGFARWRGLLVPGEVRQQATLTPMQIQGLVSQAVAQQAALQASETAASNQELASRLRQEEIRDFAQLARRQEYLELAQDASWKQTQQQSELVAMIARDYMRPDMTLHANSPKR